MKHYAPHLGSDLRTVPKDKCNEIRFCFSAIKRLPNRASGSSVAHHQSVRDHRFDEPLTHGRRRSEYAFGASRDHPRFPTNLILDAYVLVAILVYAN